MDPYLIFATDYWSVSHRKDARYAGCLIVSSIESKADLHELNPDALQELGLVLQKAEALLRSIYSPCKVIFYKLGFSSGYNCHFHVVHVTDSLLTEIVAHPDYTNEPDGNDVILFVSRIYCERPLTESEFLLMMTTIEKLREALTHLKKLAN